MKNTDGPSMAAYTSDETRDQNLRQENERLRMTNQMLWSLFADISKKMQVSSAAIKASVSSLLGYDIILGMAAQHELLEIIQKYREGLVPLIVPATLINHYVRKYDQPYLRDQVYLQPHPIALKLRNHA